MSDEQDALETLESRVRAILPEEYQDTYDEVQPTSMGSAGLKYGADGRVSWDEIWGSFCDLAMAGGPPHKGRLLQPASQADVDAQPERYAEVVEEICRGITMATGLPAEPSPHAGWVRVPCFDDGTAGWLLRAIVMENVAARVEGTELDLPAGPAFRLEKEIKNVITVIAKTYHYWMGHMSMVQQRSIAQLFAALTAEAPLVVPMPLAGGTRPDTYNIVSAHMAVAIEKATRLRASPDRSGGWLGLECPSVRAAIWMMRGLVVNNVLARREEAVLFVPINTDIDRDGDIVVRAISRVHALAAVSGVI